MTLEQRPATDAQLPRRERGRRPDLDIPPLDRAYALLYLLNRLGPLTRSQVVKLAQELYPDSPRKPLRSLAAVSQQAHLVNGNHRLQDDAFLKHVALRYSKEEMDKQFVFAIKQQTDMPDTVADILAGSGPSRPLFKELYSLSSIGLLLVEQQTAEGEEVFIPTHEGRAFAKCLRLIFDRLNWTGRNVLVEVGRTERDTRLVATDLSNFTQ